MRSDIAISVRNLTKTYRIFGHPGDRIKQAMTFGRKAYHQEFTAIQNIDFEVKKGETVGVVGRNGSGKSTLLQLVCGILKPTAGRAQVQGRISALLELGSGFSPEFTGRENIYFQGAVSGVPKKEMDSKLDEIIAFADIGDFIDQPVRIYSSGMYVRLAFAVAIYNNPDVLVVDEALSVGDEAFQRKCFERIRQFSLQGGTILYVSHNIASIVELCTSALLLDGGKIAASGDPKFVTASYLKSINCRSKTIDPEHRATPAMQEVETENFDPALISESAVSYPTNGAKISNPRILTLNGKRTNLLQTGEEYIYAYDAEFTLPATGVRYGMMVKTVRGYELGGLISHPVGRGICVDGGTALSKYFRFRCNLLCGTYFLNAGITGIVSSEGEIYLHRILDAAMFRVLPDNVSLQTGYIDLSPLYPLEHD